MIKTVNLCKTYQAAGASVTGVAALSDVNIEIQRGEFVFLVGSSGSGKSTLIKILMKDEEPTSGEVYVTGKDLRRMPHWRVPYLRRSLGVVFQDFKLLPNKTVYENIAFALEVIGRPSNVIRNLVPQVLDLIGLKERATHKPDELSGGEQQRVCIGRAFVNRPTVLLADEPTGNLDPGTSRDIVSLLDRINRTGTTIVVATHDHAVVDMMRRRV